MAFKKQESNGNYKENNRVTIAKLEKNWQLNMKCGSWKALLTVYKDTVLSGSWRTEKAEDQTQGSLISKCS